MTVKPQTTHLCEPLEVVVSLRQVLADEVDAVVISNRTQDGLQHLFMFMIIGVGLGE